MIERAKQAVEILTKGMEECETLANETDSPALGGSLTLVDDCLFYEALVVRADNNGAVGILDDVLV